MLGAALTEYSNCIHIRDIYRIQAIDNCCIEVMDTYAKSAKSAAVHFFNWLNFMMEISRSLINLTNSLTGLMKGRLWLQVIIAMILGVGFGVLIGPTTRLVDSDTSELIAGWVALPGKVFYWQCNS